MKTAYAVPLAIALTRLPASSAHAVDYPAAIVSRELSSQPSGLPPCDALLAAGLGDRLLLPPSVQYEATVDTWFAANARLRPWCFFQPQTTQEVSEGVAALYQAGNGAGDWHIAVRSGGHGIPRSNNIEYGVTIDLSMMNSSSYDTETKIARVASGARWGNVYRELHESAGVYVTGGRNELVGVGGFLLGGGNSYYTGIDGFGCDTVTSFEVVLANGTIVNANAQQHSDLWRALKGGGPNFGLVTHVELETMPAADLAYGQRIVLANYSQEVTLAIVDFTDSSSDHPEDHTFAFYMHNTAISEEIVTLLITANVHGNMNTTGFDNFTKIPAITESWKLAPLEEAAASGDLIPDGMKGIQSTLTLLNEQHNLDFAVEIHNEFVNDLSQSIGADNFLTSMFFQPLPTYFAAIGQQKGGGNVVGLEHIPGNAIIWVFAAGITNGTDADVAVAEAMLAAAVAKMKRYTDEQGSGADWIYVNYAGAQQDPIASAGADNVAFMREVAGRYDPEGFWQERVPGGFKLARTDA